MGRPSTPGPPPAPPGPPALHGWRITPPRGQSGTGLRIVGRAVNIKVRGEEGPTTMWLTTQGGDIINFSRIDAIWTQFYPRIAPDDPPVSYDVMCQGAATYVIGRYGSEARALQVRDAIIAAEDADTDYTVPAS